MSYIQAEAIEPLKEVINIIIKDKQKKSANPNKDAQTTEELLTSQIVKGYAREKNVGLYNQEAKEILSELEQEKGLEEERGV